MKVPISTVTDSILDVVLDVAVALRNDSTAQAIRNGLRDQILSIYEAGNPLYVVAHSLGSVYAYQVINELMLDRPNGCYTRDLRKTWPVQSLVTMGSPLGLSMFQTRAVQKLGPGRRYFRWINYWDRTDPVVSGSFYGRPHEGYDIVERLASLDHDEGWLVQDRIVDVGRAWLAAHTGYWSRASLGDDLITLLTT